MKVPILVSCGGRATRMGELCQNTPKALLPVEGFPILDLVFRFLAEAGAGPIILVIEHLGEQIVRHCQKGLVCPRVDVEFVDSSQHGGSTHLLAARRFVRDSALAVAGNILLRPSAVVAAMRFAALHPGVPAVASSQCQHATGHLTSIPHQEAPHWLSDIVRGCKRRSGEWEMVDLYVITPRVLEIMEADQISHCRAIERMCRDGERVGHIPVGDWAHFETPGDLISESNIAMARKILTIGSSYTPSKRCT